MFLGQADRFLLSLHPVQGGMLSVFFFFFSLFVFVSSSASFARFLYSFFFLRSVFGIHFREGFFFAVVLRFGVFGGVLSLFFLWNLSFDHDLENYLLVRSLFFCSFFSSQGPG